MKLGAVYSESVNALYRVVIPMLGLQARGHEVVEVRQQRGRPLPIEALADCDLVHFHRPHVSDPRSDPLLRLKRAGVAVSLDEDDDMSVGTPEIEAIVGSRNFAVGQLEFGHLLARMRDVDLVTTPSEVLADRFEQAGAPTIEVIDNYVLDQFAGMQPQGHEGFVIGWHACAEHMIDAERLRIAEALEQVLERHAHVRAVTIGVDLGIGHERYEASASIPFDTLTQRLADFDLGLAPVADTPFGRARSNIKLREYAAAGVPWLASDVAPYQGLGDAEGGRLVGAGEWLEAIDAAVLAGDALRGQRERARAWGAAETISATCHLWEEAFLDTIAAAEAAA